MGIKPIERKYTEMNNAKKKNFGIVKRRIAVIILFFTAVFHLFPMGVWANSAVKEWSGTDASGVAAVDKSCPVTVKNEKLTFDIPSFPSNYSEDDFSEYRSSVTARYEFYNPTKYEVTAVLAFPFGVAPEYRGDGDYHSHMDTSRYGVKINGETAEVLSLRHTYFDRYSETFETEEQLARLQINPLDDREDIFDRKYLTVTAYTYRVTGTEEECHASLKISDVGDLRYVIADNDYYSVNKDEIGIGVFIDEAAGQNCFTVYIVGKPLEDTVKPRLFKNSMELQEVKGTVTLESTEKLQLCDLAMRSYDPEGEVSELDHVNAVTQCVFVSWEKHAMIAHYEYDIADIDSHLMQWYVYDMIIPAGDTVVNEVTAPLYPDIDDGFVPSLYTYNYLLCPARTWAGFGELDIEIITPYYLIECDIFPKFEKTESGYATSLNGLPSGELRFTLSSDPSPKREITPYTFLGIGIYAVIIGAVVAVPAAVVTVTVILVKKHRKTR